MCGVGPPKLVKTTDVVQRVEYDTGLDRRDTRNVRLKLPQTLRLSQEAIQERLWVPVLSPVAKPRVAALSSLSVLQRLSKETRGLTYA